METKLTHFHTIGKNLVQHNLLEILLAQKDFWNPKLPNVMSGPTQVSFLSSCRKMLYPHGTIAGKYSCLELSLTFRRSTGRAYLTCYFPMGGLVVLSWIVFWMSVESQGAITARVFVGLMTIVTTMGISLFGYPSMVLPNVAYSLAIDKWKVRWNLAMLP